MCPEREAEANGVLMSPHLLELYPEGEPISKENERLWFFLFKVSSGFLTGGEAV